MDQETIIRILGDSSFHHRQPAAVEVIQTHISWIVIAGEEVYKIKKAVNFGFLDFSTLEKRKFYCEEEVRLNRRLAPQVYLGVTAIHLNGPGKLVMDVTAGEIVEYAVHMKKIPTENMLKNLLSKPDFDPLIMSRIAKKIAQFHEKAETGGRIDEIGGLETVRFNQEENFTQTEPFRGITISPAKHRFIRASVHRFLEKNESLFRRRVQRHRIRDCHGDLHLEHIVVSPDEMTIFDCIEFNERIRYGDVATDVSFLAMDLDFHGYNTWSKSFAASYVEESGDEEINFLLPFYQCYYAFVRGKVTGFQLNDPHIAPAKKEEATSLAAKYFDLASSYAARLHEPRLIITAGLMGSGKSAAARELAEITGAFVIQMDALRKEMRHIDPAERHLENFGHGIYDGDTTQKTYQRAFNMAEKTLREGRSVIIDASFAKRDHRIAAGNMAKTLNIPFLILECVCPEGEIKKRLEQRIQHKNEASDGRLEIFAAQKDNFEPVSECQPGEHFVLNTAGPLDEIAEKTIEIVFPIPR
ncbi:MAG: AAA family ATPase [Syntrophobacterales bacterium]|jgi:aminoglycoside phosphotransferase family enzyme/predicted kinase|nr:AAA family ATPase [Syntrophobacterales bacterium]